MDACLHHVEETAKIQSFFLDFVFVCDEKGDTSTVKTYTAIANTMFQLLILLHS